EINSENILPDAYALEQNYPNPFNPETRIRYAIPEPGHVTLRIFRIDGQLVRTLQDANQSPGRYERIWDGKNEFGNKVSSGVYFYQLYTSKFLQTKKLILLK
ncbi:MAG: T9SS type A sorting domain-containing protein, partial [Ignavibacteriaceae bacterium]